MNNGLGGKGQGERGKLKNYELGITNLREFQPLNSEAFNLSTAKRLNL